MRRHGGMWSVMQKLELDGLCRGGSWWDGVGEGDLGYGSCRVGQGGVTVVLHNQHNLVKHSASASSQHGAVHVMCLVENKELNPPHLCLLLSWTNTNITWWQLQGSCDPMHQFWRLDDTRNKDYSQCQWQGIFHKIQTQFCTVTWHHR